MLNWAVFLNMEKGKESQEDNCNLKSVAAHCRDMTHSSTAEPLPLQTSDATNYWISGGVRLLLDFLLHKEESCTTASVWGATLALGAALVLQSCPRALQSHSCAACRCWSTGICTRQDWRQQNTCRALLQWRYQSVIWVGVTPCALQHSWAKNFTHTKKLCTGTQGHVII